MEKTLQQLETEYGISCAKLGDLIFKSEMIERDINSTKHHIEKVHRDAIAARNKEQNQKAEEARTEEVTKRDPGC